MGIMVLVCSLHVVLFSLQTSGETAQSGRFLVLDEFQKEAVLDQETQLIWERRPDLAGTVWGNAPMRCALKSRGGRSGWRLPSFLELMTLVVPSPHGRSTIPSLPAAHPFHDVQAVAYWTTSSDPSDPKKASAVDFLTGDVVFRQKNHTLLSWCVRGGVADHRPNDKPEAAQNSI
jgi:hypothetical protein